MPEGWTWDETLYRGSAPWYERGRLPYPPGLADGLASALHLDGRQRLLDVGCGPGTIALRVAHLFGQVVGIDADRDMIAEAARRADEMGIVNARFQVLRAEELPAGLGRFEVATFGQSFHWFERERVARTTFDLLTPGGAFVHVGFWSLVGDEVPSDDPLPPYRQLDQLVESWLGSQRRAGQGVLPAGTPSGEAEILAAAGFEGPEIVSVPGGQVVRTGADDLIARYLSKSGSAPHLFGDRLDAFVADATTVLSHSSATGRFAERVRDGELAIWRRPERS